eukprot:2614569-Ditylum_brightwellii.AAC.1
MESSVLGYMDVLRSALVWPVAPSKVSIMLSTAIVCQEFLFKSGVLIYVGSPYTSWGSYWSHVWSGDKLQNIAVPDYDIRK